MCQPRCYYGLHIRFAVKPDVRLVNCLIYIRK